MTISEAKMVADINQINREESINGRRRIWTLDHRWQRIEGSDKSTELWQPLHIPKYLNETSDRNFRFEGCRQCDQMWRNLAKLTTFSWLWQFFESLLVIFGKMLTLIGNFQCHLAHFLKPHSHPYGFYWGHQCSWTLTPVNSMQVSIMQSDNCNRK